MTGHAFYRAKTSSRSDTVHLARVGSYETLCGRTANWSEQSGMAMGPVTCPICLKRRKQ